MSFDLRKWFYPSSLFGRHQPLEFLKPVEEDDLTLFGVLHVSSSSSFAFASEGEVAVSPVGTRYPGQRSVPSPA